MIDRQWNWLSEDCLTTVSITSIAGLLASHRPTLSPNRSRSLALVAEKTFALRYPLRRWLSIELSGVGYEP